jgi:hypothetical protein
MSLAGITAALLREAGVSADDILAEAGVDRKQAVRALSEKLGVDINELADTPKQREGTPVEITDSEVAAVRQGLEVLNRAFG